MKLIRQTDSSTLRTRDDLEAYVWPRVVTMMAAESIVMRPEQITRETHLIEDLGFR